MLWLRGLSPRDASGRLVATLMGVSILLIVAAASVLAFKSPTGLPEKSTQLILAIIGLLVGTVSGFLARQQGDDSIRAVVGVILSVTLGGALILLAGVVFLDAWFAQGPGLSDNMANLLSSILGGTIGAVAAYLGIPGVHGAPRLPMRDSDQEDIAAQEAVSDHRAAPEMSDIPDDDFDDGENEPVEDHDEEIEDEGAEG